MKTRKTIGFVLAIAGLFIAVCTKDGSSHELACRSSASPSSPQEPS